MRSSDPHAFVERVLLPIVMAIAAVVVILDLFIWRP